MVELIMEKDHMEKLYSSRNPLVKFIFNARLDELTALIPHQKNCRILDAGCGEGQFLLRLSKLGYENLYGADVTEVAIQSAKERVKGAHFSIADLAHVPYEDGFFDVVVCTEVIEHIPHYEETITELKRVLKKDGLLIITFPNEPLAILCRTACLRRPTIKDHVNWFFPAKMKKAVGLALEKKINVPFRLPDVLTLIHIMVFRKSV